MKMLGRNLIMRYQLVQLGFAVIDPRTNMGGNSSMMMMPKSASEFEYVH
jgi:hypothetical protein